MDRDVFQPSHVLLTHETCLASACLASGLNALRRSGLQDKGAIYGALFNLSIGIERLLKATYVIDHMLKNKFAVPADKKLRNFGHDVLGLYDECSRNSQDEDVKLPRASELDGITYSIVKMLGDFALRSRYFNIDALNKTPADPDPLVQLSSIFWAILDERVSVNVSYQVIRRARFLTERIGGKLIVRGVGLNSKPLTIAEALSHPVFHEKAAKYAVLRVVEFLWPIRDLLTHYSMKAHCLDSHEAHIPEMWEFLTWLGEDRKSVLRKKKWP